MASKVTDPQAAARSTLGSGRHTTTKARISATPHRAVARKESPRRGARPPRSARCARAGAPMSRKSTTVRLEPETASRCSRSVARNASCRSGSTREVSPTTSPGSRALASGASPSVTSRSPARSRPAIRCAASGPPVTRGGASPAGRSSATARSPPRAGASRAATSTRIEGCNRAHPGCPASTRTGVETLVRAPSGPVTRVTTASRTTTGGPLPVRAVRGSEPTVRSASTRAWSRASSGTGPARASARWSPATPAPAAAHSRAAATAVPALRNGVERRRPASINSPATPTPSPATAALRPTGTSRATAAATQAAEAGTTNRRSAGPASTGPRPTGPCSDEPPAAGPPTAGPRAAGSRSGAPLPVAPRSGAPLPVGPASDESRSVKPGSVGPRRDGPAPAPPTRLTAAPVRAGRRTAAHRSR